MSDDNNFPKNDNAKAFDDDVYIPGGAANSSKCYEDPKNELLSDDEKQQIFTVVHNDSEEIELMNKIAFLEKDYELMGDITTGKYFESYSLREQYRNKYFVERWGEDKDQLSYEKKPFEKQKTKKSCNCSMFKEKYYLLLEKLDEEREEYEGELDYRSLYRRKLEQKRDLEECNQKLREKIRSLEDELALEKKRRRDFKKKAGDDLRKKEEECFI